MYVAGGTRLRACPNPIQACGTGRNGTGCSWPFVPFLGKKTCLGPSRILGLASQISTNDNLLRMPRAQQQRVVRKMCPLPFTVMSISIKQYFICARLVGPFGPPESPQAKDVGCRSNFDPSRPLYTQDTSFSVKSSLTAVCQGVQTLSTDIFAPSLPISEYRYPPSLNFVLCHRSLRARVRTF